MDETDDPRAIHDEKAGHLSDIPNGLPRRIPTPHGVKSAPPDPPSEYLGWSAGAQAVRRISLSIGIGQTRERRRTFLTKSARLFHVALADEHDLGTLFPKPLVVASQPGDVLAAERSAIMAQENEDGGPLRPKIGQAHGPTISAKKLHIRRLIPNVEHRFPRADLALP